MWNGANWLRSATGGRILWSQKLCLLFKKMGNFSTTFGLGKQTTWTVRLKSTAFSVHHSYNSPPSKPTKHRQPTEIHRKIVKIYVTSVNSAGRQAAERQLLNRRQGQSLCSFFPWPGFSWSNINFQRRILPTEQAFVNYHPVARHFS